MRQMELIVGVQLGQENILRENSLAIIYNGVSHR